MNPLDRKRQADIIIHCLTKIKIRIRFRKPDNLPLPFLRIVAVGWFLTELDAQTETGLNRESQLFKASVASHSHIAGDITVNPDEMPRLLRKDLYVKIRRQNL